MTLLVALLAFFAADDLLGAGLLCCKGERSKRKVLSASVSLPASKAQSQDRSFGFDSGPRALGAAVIFVRFSNFPPPEVSYLPWVSTDSENDGGGSPRH